MRYNYEISSGNVFADLGFAQSEEMLAKAKLAHQINTLIKEKELTQAAAAKLLQVDQPKISALNTGRLSGFSLERLFRFLAILDQEITITVTPKKKKSSHSVIVVTTLKTKKRPTARSQSTPRSPAIQARKKNK